MERMASGKRINSAADDAANLAISTRITAEIQGLKQSVKNAADAQSLLNVTEGALSESTPFY
jgi:flagellin